MSRIVTITSVTANTPVDIYYCDAMSASCVYVSTVATFPYVFEVPSPYDTEDVVIKITDTQGCVDGDIIYITPTPTPSITPSQTLTPTSTVTPTLSPTQTPSFTPTSTQTPSVTPSITSTPTATPVVAFHVSSNSCQSAPNITGYYTYISEANLTPVVGATVYQTLLNGVLYNPFNGGGNLFVLSFGGNLYQVRINSQGLITEFSICS